MRRYLCEDNHRSQGFEHRARDIVVSTRSKCGTTWCRRMDELATPALRAWLHQ